jgi:hypothetical protein
LSSRVVSVDLELDIYFFYDQMESNHVDCRTVYYDDYLDLKAVAYIPKRSWSRCDMDIVSECIPLSFNQSPDKEREIRNIVASLLLTE